MTTTGRPFRNRITSGEDRFMEWKTKDGTYENKAHAQFDTFFEGMFEQARFLDILKNFICFCNEGVTSYKILAGYHQYFAVRKAVASTVRASGTGGGRPPAGAAPPVSVS